jgi:hypothetical protein
LFAILRPTRRQVNAPRLSGSVLHPASQLLTPRVLGGEKLQSCGGMLGGRSQVNAGEVRKDCSSSMFKTGINEYKRLKTSPEELAARAVAFSAWEHVVLA